MFGTLPIPVIFAHRGASAHAPENTLSSFKLARDQGAKAIELDVQLTADRIVVVFHDSTLNRTTNGIGKISDYSLADLQNLNAGQAYGPAFTNERIPTLSEVFNEFSDIPLINIELKNLSSPLDDLPELVSHLIHDHQISDRVLISSFNRSALRKFYQLMPEIPLGRLVHSPLTLKYFELISSQLNIFRSVHVSSSALNTRRIEFLHSLDKLVFTYTLNHPSDMLDAINLGVDGFFTDDPGLAIRTLEQNRLDN